MQYDLYLVIGLVIVVFSIPAIVSAYSESRAPRIAALLLLVGGGLVAFAIIRNPTGYTLEDIPRAFVRVVAHYIW